MPDVSLVPDNSTLFDNDGYMNKKIDKVYHFHFFSDMLFTDVFHSYFF